MWIPFEKSESSCSVPASLIASILPALKKNDIRDVGSTADLVLVPTGTGTGTGGTSGAHGNKNIALVWSRNYVSSQKLPQYLLKFPKAAAR